MIRTTDRDDIFVKNMFPPRDPDSHKGTFGYIAIAGGSLEYSGAIRLAGMASAALRAGAGVATAAAPRSICHAIIPEILEATVFPLSDRDGRLVFAESEWKELTHHRRVIAFGPGFGRSEGVKAALAWLLRSYEGILIVDADGLNCLSELDASEIAEAKPHLVLTPHIMEFSRLSGYSVAEITADPAGLAAEYALRFNSARTGTEGTPKVTLLLKGHTTYVTDGSILFRIRKGGPGMATAGSGDVLTGILSAVCSCNPGRLPEAAAAGAYINGLAGEIAEEKYGAAGMTAGDTARSIAYAIKNITSVPRH